jgi:diguanylate cyclase (GGDEF)-like protein/PAS domain S-box-containing protein
VDGLSRLVDHLPDAVIVVDHDGVLRYANDAALELHGNSAADRVGRSCFDLIHPGDQELALVSLAAMEEQAVGTPLELRVRSDRGWILVEMLGAATQLPDGRPGVVLSLRDLTERRRWDIAAGDDAQFRSVVQNGVNLILLLDAEGTVLTTSATLTRTLGHNQSVILGQPITELILDEDRVAFDLALRRALDGSPEGDSEGIRVEARLRTRRGTHVPHQLHILNLLDDPTVGSVVLTGHDITELHQAREELSRIAFADPLTGLPNRWELIRELSSRLRQRRPGDEHQVGVAFIDLDRFKPVNDLFGHAAGDELLVALAVRLRRMVRAGDLVARIGGDEFVVVADIARAESLQSLRHRLETALLQPIELSVGTIQIGASIGTVTASSGDSAETVLAEADAVMYEEKHRRRGMRTDHRLPVAERRAIAEALDAAFDNEEFLLHYQPIVDLQTGRVVEFEALVRWQHPKRGLLTPAEFLDVIEDVGRDDQLARFVVCRATEDLATARVTHGLEIGIAVNASAAQFADPSFADLVADQMRHHHVPPGSLTVEVSERSILERTPHGPAIAVSAGLQALVDRGIRIAVDDFGTGYSSLSHLVSFPIDAIKIDRSFVSRMLTERESRSVVTALISLARSLRQDIVAEGVESHEQLRKLRGLGCSRAQGYLLGVPLPFEQAVVPLLSEPQQVGQ